MDGHLRGDAGWIELICGDMFGGESEELIRHLRRIRIFEPGIGALRAEDESVFHGALRSMLRTGAGASRGRAGSALLNPVLRPGRGCA